MKRALVEIVKEAEIVSHDFAPDQWSPPKIIAAVVACIAGRESDAIELGLMPPGMTSGVGWQELTLLREWIDKLDDSLENVHQADQLFDFLMR